MQEVTAPLIEKSEDSEKPALTILIYKCCYFWLAIALHGNNREAQTRNPVFLKLNDGECRFAECKVQNEKFKVQNAKPYRTSISSPSKDNVI
jgi:hypothetical protein